MDLEDFENNTAYAKYIDFSISPNAVSAEEDGYTLFVAGFEDGGAGTPSASSGAEAVGGRGESVMEYWPWPIGSLRPLLRPFWTWKSHTSLETLSSPGEQPPWPCSRQLCTRTAVPPLWEGGRLHPNRMAHSVVPRYSSATAVTHSLPAKGSAPGLSGSLLSPSCQVTRCPTTAARSSPPLTETRTSSCRTVQPSPQEPSGSEAATSPISMASTWVVPTSPMPTASTGLSGKVSTTPSSALR